MQHDPIRRASRAPRDPLDAEARRTLGFDRLTPDQRAAIEAVLDGRDTVAVLPTGAGKSAVYQLAGSLIPGPTLVISPLIALQEDQLAALRELRAGRAEALNATLGVRRRREVLAALGRGEVEFLLLAPEQLAAEGVLAQLQAVEPSLFVVDEAHCIAEWGHDFRPDYLRLGAAIEALGRPRVLALTATASPTVREEIAARLGMDDPVLVVRDPDRPELDLAVEHLADERARLDRVVALAQETGGTTIVYGATRAGVERITTALEAAGITAAAYHAGLAAGRRSVVLGGFLDGTIRAVVATSAFGMGVDKPDVRAVIHAHAPPSLDAYWQEVGRAGRDGEPARAVLCFRQEDLGLRRFFAAGGAPDPEVVARVIGVVRAAGHRGVSRTRIAAAVGVTPGRLESILGALLLLDVVRVSGARAVVRGASPMDEGDAAVAAVEAEARRIAAERSRVEQVGAYAASATCRRAFVLAAFGQAYEPPCGACDRCRAAAAAALDVTATPADPAEADAFAAVRQRYPLGSAVNHATWGPGTVERVEPEVVTVRFASVGHRQLALELVESTGLLRPGPVVRQP